MATRKLSVLALAAVAVLALSATASAQTIEVVTNIGGGGPQGQPEDAACVREGSYALRATTPGIAGSAAQAFVQATPDQGFNNETVLRHEFWFHPDGMAMDGGARHQVMATLQPGAGQRAVKATLINTAGGYQMVAQCTRNCASPPCSQIGSGRVNIANDWQLVRVEWSHNTPAPAPPDGVCRISIIDGAGAGQSTEALTRNSQYTGGRVRLGLIGNSFRATTIGNHCYDSYQAFRTLSD